MDWQSALSPDELAALPVGSDDHPVYAELSDGSRYLIDYGPWLDGQLTWVLTHGVTQGSHPQCDPLKRQGHRIGRVYRSIKKAQRAALEHMLSHGLRPKPPSSPGPPEERDRTQIGCSQHRREGVRK